MYLILRCCKEVVSACTSVEGKQTSLRRASNWANRIAVVRRSLARCCQTDTAVSTSRRYGPRPRRTTEDFGGVFGLPARQTGIAGLFERSFGPELLPAPQRLPLQSDIVELGRLCGDEGVPTGGGPPSLEPVGEEDGVVAGSGGMLEGATAVQTVGPEL